MAFTAGFSVNVGDPTKASDVDVLAANDDYLKNAIDTFIANDANNRVLTATGSGTANAESNLTFDGSTLTVTGTVSATTLSGNVTGGTISGTTGTFSGDVAVNTSTLKVDTSNNRVGVKNANPSYPLDIGYTAGINQVAWRGSSNEIGFLTYGSSTDAGAVQLSSGGAAKILFDAAGASYVNTGSNFGINTASPQTDLHIKNASTNSVSRIETTHTSSYAQLQLVNQSGNYWYQTLVNADNSYRLYNGSDRLTVLSGGNVGIGTSIIPDNGTNSRVLQIKATSGAGTLHLTNDSTGTTTSDGFIISASGTDAYLINRESGAMYLRTADTNRISILSGGNVGIGADSPTSRLHIIGSNGDPSAAHSGSAQLILENNANTFLEIATGAAHYAGLTFSDGTATRGAVLYDHGTGLGGGADSLHVQTGGSLRAVINSSGDVGIGSLSPTYKLVVSNAGAAGYEFNVSGLNGGVNTVVYNRTTSAYVDSAHFALNYYIFTGSAPAEVLRATSAGEVWIKNTSDQGAYNLQVGGTGVWGAGAYVNGSDERLKKSIATYTDNALDLVNQMRPVTFEYVEDYSNDRATQIGFIAQDLQEVLQGKEYLDGIVKDDAEHLNVAYQSLIPVLTKAIQELTVRIEALEAA